MVKINEIDILLANILLSELNASCSNRLVGNHKHWQTCTKALPSLRWPKRHGVAFSDQFTSNPEIEFGLSNCARYYSLGWRFTLAQRGVGTLELGVMASRRKHVNDEPSHVIGFRLTARW